MAGNNRIVLCPAEMQRAVQHYFQTKLFRPDACPQVTGVRMAGGVDGSFEIAVAGDLPPKQ